MIDELSIVIPALNEAGYLPELLQSISQQTYTGKLQVIVVDGNSTDNTAGIARGFAGQLPDLLVLQTKSDIGHQRNMGAAQAKYGYLLFLDADVILPSDLLQRLTAKVHVTEPFIIGTMHTTAHLNAVDRLFLVGVYVLLFITWVARVPAINGDFIFTTRKQHQRIHGFVEGALLGEDSDYAIRSVKAGATYRYLLNPKVIASDRRVRLMGRTKLFWLWTRGYLRVMKHGPIFPGEGFEYPFGHYKNGPKP